MAKAVDRAVAKADREKDRKAHRGKAGTAKAVDPAVAKADKPISSPHHQSRLSSVGLPTRSTPWLALRGRRKDRDEDLHKRPAKAVDRAAAKADREKGRMADMGKAGTAMSVDPAVAKADKDIGGF